MNSSLSTKMVGIKNIIIVFIMYGMFSVSAQTTTNKENLVPLDGYRIQVRTDEGVDKWMEFENGKINLRKQETNGKITLETSLDYASVLVSPNVYLVKWLDRKNQSTGQFVLNLSEGKMNSSMPMDENGDKAATTIEEFDIMKIEKEMDQQKNRFSDISGTPDQYSMGNLVVRMIEGLGFRYYWATEGLNEKDLSYVPSDGARSTRETLEHIYDLTKVIYNTSSSKPNSRSDVAKSLSYQELVNKSLSNLDLATKQFENMPAHQIADLKIIFGSGANQRKLPFWYSINGPISDAIYHVGQIVSFRRITGNPINPKVNVLVGKLNE